MLKIARDGIVPDVPGEVGPMTQIEELKAKGFPLAYVGDVVGTGSSRKSATNSVSTQPIRFCVCLDLPLKDGL